VGEIVIALTMLVHEGHAHAMRFFTPANAGSYDLILRLATFGRDNAWKYEIIKKLSPHSQILELACGTGVLSSMLLEKGKSVTGIDLTFEYLLSMKHKLNAPIVQGTAEVLPYLDESFDSVVSSYLAKYVNVHKVVYECWRVLRPGGIVIFHDFTYPRGVIRSLWNMHFGLLRLAGRFIGSWKVVFEDLDDVIKESDWVNQTIISLRDRKFQNVGCRYYTGGTSAMISAEKP
jgi:demethylmenaquinone methyltransferase/2-methoxy-6-polyprenyl-1,4-benzoquinol methylase